MRKDPESPKHFATARPTPELLQSPTMEPGLDNWFISAEDSSPEIDPLLDRIFGEHYRLESRLGAGNNGSVYRARHLHLDTTFAIKLLAARKKLDSKALLRFTREAQVAVGLHHPNIAALAHFGIHDERPFSVLEYVEGKSLSAILAETGSLEPTRALNIMKQILQGLEYAHSNKIVHRDIKPSNIMISRSNTGEEEVKIVDFGIAKMLDSDKVTITEAGEIFGTPNYMSPEQVRGQTTDQRSDIYSLGCLAYEMLSGSPPFTGTGIVDVLLKHLNQEPIPICAVPGYPGIEKVIHRSLNKDPKYRYPSAQAMLDDIRLVEAGSQPKRSFIISKKTYKRAAFITYVILLLAFANGVISYRSDTLTSLTQEIARQPDSASAYQNRAKFFERGNRYEEALADYRKARTLEAIQKNCLISTSIVYCLIELGQYEEASAEADQALARFPRESTCYLVKGQAQIRLKQAKEALENANKSITLNKTRNPVALYQSYCLKAAANYELKNYQQSADDANEAIGIGRSFGSKRAYEHRAIANLALGKIKEAMADAQSIYWLMITIP
ncbi:MAG: protein kinase [Candidatus Obscuribacterales bacterium]|nr:protein kinase [Candidatus Obscuribacterales bacterium]